MKLNRKLIEKMIQRLEDEPRTYDQGTLGEPYDQRKQAYEFTAALPRPEPRCGTVACLAGQAIICSERSLPTALATIDRLANRPYGVAAEAAQRMGITQGFDTLHRLFGATSREWPEPFASQWKDAKTYRGQTRAAINLLRAILRTDGEILEGSR